MKKKFVRFFMRDKRLDITLPFEQAERVIDSSAQLVKISDKDGGWSGRTINKADVMGTERDYDEEADKNYNRSQLPEPEFKPLDTEKFKPEFLKNQIAKDEVLNTPTEELVMVEQELK